MTASESRVDFYRRWGALNAPYFRWQFEQFASYTGKRVADIGCGLGNFLPFLKNTECYLGFEPDAALRQEFQKHCTAPEIILSPSHDITDSRAAAALKAHAVDTIFCINVLEHIENDAQALKNMLEGLSPGGHLCLLVPALQALYGSLDRLDGHYRRYEKKQLLELASAAADSRARVVKCRYMNFPGIFGWFLKSKVLKEKTQKDENYMLMNKILPVVAAVEKLIPPPLGMSLVLVLKKEAIFP